MSEAPLIGKREFEHDGPVIRLVYCLVCNTIEELPPHEGPAETDVLLEVTLERHEFPSGERHMGKMFILPIKTWANKEHRKEIIDQLKSGSSGLDALTEEKDFYATKMQFAEDAMQCWKYHLYPKDVCPDYETENMKILPKTEKERKELGLPAPKDLVGPSVYTCHFCPMHTVMTTKKRALRGMYD